MKQVFFVPERGDIVLISSASGTGPGQAGRRHAVVLSPQAYNARVGLALLCPISGDVRGYPFEVLIPSGLPVQGVILADRAESLDWRSRRAEWIGSLSGETVEEARGKLRALLS